MQRGHRAACMCFVVHGRVKVLKLHTQMSSTSALGNEDEEKGDVDPEAPLTVFTPTKSQVNNLILEPPSWIGDICLFKETIRKNTVEALTHTEILTVAKDSIHQLLGEFPRLQPLYDEWRRKVHEQGEAAVLCPHCQEPGHDASRCPKLAQFLQAQQKDNENIVERSENKVPTSGGFAGGIKVVRDSTASSRFSEATSSLSIGGGFRKVLSMTAFNRKKERSGTALGVPRVSDITESQGLAPFPVERSHTSTT